MGKRGTDTDKDTKLCMVVGCARKALYRNALSVRAGGTERGYCSEHKAMATPKTSQARRDQIGRNLADRILSIDYYDGPDD